MFRRSSLSLCVALASFGLISGSLILRAQDDDSHHGRKYKVPPASAHIEVTVVRDYNGKPIHDAHVIFHPIQGDRDTGALELKTNEDGKAIIDVIPIGDTVTLQVIANGFQTYGQVYKVDKLDISMEVRLSLCAVLHLQELQPGFRLKQWLRQLRIEQTLRFFESIGSSERKPIAARA